MKQKNNLTQGPVASKLISLTIPMVFGLFSLVTFNIVDTFFVSRLGTNELAAMGFTFPAVMFVMGVAWGLGVATSSLVSRAIGKGDHNQAQRFTTDSLILSFFIVILLTVLGLFTINKVFALLGSPPQIIALIKQYMSIWYSGIIFVVVLVVGNNTIRACGDMLYSSLITVASAVINIVLDPLLIFGLAGFPRLELAGAAIATVIAYAFAMLFSLLILHFREKLVDFSLPKLHEVLDSFKRILYIALPSTASRLVIPFTMAIITRLVAQFGPAAVAAVGVSMQIEMFVYIVILALAAALAPFIGQNWGAEKFERVRLARVYTNRFSLWWGGLSFVLILVLAGPIGNLFSKDPEVSRNITYYLWILSLSYGLRSIAILTEATFNAINKPLMSSAIITTHMFLLYIPFAYLGALWFGLVGLFAGLCLANIFAGAIALWWGRAIVSVATQINVTQKRGRLLQEEVDRG